MLSSIDIVIPSYRLDERYILPILNLKRPANILLKFYLVVDNPRLTVSKAIADRVDNISVFLLMNHYNLGPALTRNRGIESSRGDWILFLDDDVQADEQLLVTYTNALNKFDSEIGFIGLVNMPQPLNYFTRIVKLSHAMGVFEIALHKKNYAWGATANLLISRQAIGDIRFSDIYLSEKFPKTGGGEEVDFFLRVRASNGFKNYKCLPEASVTHPWWNNGRPGFTRFYKYGIGNSHLAQRNPQYAWYDFLNTTETLLVLVVALLLAIIVYLKIAVGIAVFIAGTLLIEFIITNLRLYRDEGKFLVAESFGVMYLRNLYEAGILIGNLSRFRLIGIGERFNYDGSTKKTHFRFNRYKIIKLVLYALVIGLLLFTAG